MKHQTEKFPAPEFLSFWTSERILARDYLVFQTLLIRAQLEMLRASCIDKWTEMMMMENGFGVAALNNLIIGLNYYFSSPALNLAEGLPSAAGEARKSAFSSFLWRAGL